jgi:FAD:protein FMN transferase
LSVRALLLTLCLALTACAADPPAWEQAFPAMGTEIRVLIAGAETGDPTPHFEAVETLLRQIAVDYYPWADGELAALNAALAEGRSFLASGELAGLLAQAQNLSRLSGGAFDPGIGHLVELWGFHEPRPGVPAEPPPEAAIAEALAGCIGIARISVRGRQVSSTCRGPMIDLGGVAKGYAVDEVMRLLRARGVANALIDAGGDLRAMGRNGRRPWRVGIQDPREAGVLGSIALASGEAAFTSGDYARYFTHAGERYAHVIDPATGRPVRHTAAVTVLGGRGLAADAASTALMVAGPDRWRETAERLGTRAVMRVDADGRIDMTRLFANRLEEDGTGGRRD